MSLNTLTAAIDQSSVLTLTTAQPENIMQQMTIAIILILLSLCD